jgi:hypothetical protein
MEFPKSQVSGFASASKARHHVRGLHLHYGTSSASQGHGESISERCLAHDIQFDTKMDDGGRARKATITVRKSLAQFTRRVTSEP